MFSINPYLLFAIIIGSFLLWIGLWIGFGFWYGFPFLLTFIGSLAAYILFGTLFSATKLISAGKTKEAGDRLNLTKFPQFLYPTQKANYYIIKGSLEIQKENLIEAEKYFNLANQVNLTSDDEKAMIEIQLVSIYLKKSNYTKAKIHYRNIQKLKIKVKEIKDQMAYLDKAMSQVNSMKSQQIMAKQSGFNINQGFSGKRRRPKMR